MVVLGWQSLGLRFTSPAPAARATILPDAVGTAYDASASAASWAAG
ncbi:hypothetical protein EN974_16690 [Mesorhizobium sp. M7A.F.Ca.CA.001.12.2.1]|uniref:Uncharacterized protein n=1 Tax=Mesorhizobium ciceri biovar biserrulae (strain HAMBI 2942 / LMG 23838 / WSM1271) TaxID=765698 RepID=E8TM55_MESCW|nr:hypothetical protein Mesci_2407 [Mesorhizobium ciceri biovar biserrulae WSM1271]RUY97983.1 hypothetical protein EN974_16690 [Mesorhizobium sp. M7A.F.Ca.CA.001.12.2.1]RUZ21009.1 hypothetical protein EN949_22265 [Mesorhizobium sp. M7A.F.Ca.US.007.01.2.1]RUZ44837.1 hypothetical protein EN948_21565 [Mesorhizobium sp. M7A.F.Ca.US.003.02.1.1]RUZ62562.1 hypothetical protein EN950_16775 [Mesorhizobium sp. M7A.F.Ca.US.007.01.1.1]RUZ83435.1 hypothetical protein EN947_15910 [Mesorhizobium sp. M7A.F.Ca